jgi:hypothetical protein
MSNICVKEESDERLHLGIEPTAVTWAVAIGVLSFIIGYPLYSYECIGFILMLWVLGTFGMLAFFNPWQEVILDKTNQTLVIDRQNFYQRYNFKTSSPTTYGVDNILSVKYESPNIVFTLTNYQTIDLNVRGDSAAIDELVKKMQDFLQLDERQGADVGTPLSETGSVLSEAANEDSSSATSDDSFERIEAADLAEYESPKQDHAEVNDDIPSEAIESLSPTSEDPEDAPTLQEEEPEALTTESKEEELAATELGSESSDEPRPKSAAAGDVAADPVGSTTAAGQSQ